MIRRIVAGGRKERIYADGWIALDKLPRPDVVLCGMAHGVDLDGREWARHHGITVEEYPPDDAHGWPEAAFLRNAEMARRATEVVLFPGGNGTDHMYGCAAVRGLTIYDWRKGVDTQRRLF
jgi:hypothetical protein